ncbi:SurA N-terminal domain-containing protein [Paraferrimonas sedimenticola]|uniref:Periplasmic chaperone PpiD n=1 Tax=Paraferrimonas sedimenticola TaxID=375674 RepID=A0AA37RTL5_9GAMM|nr:SurA N-terminal domain-containing protein [Paraferrimonas sedimenticola]GLP94847.1 peptidylprolyl isomerase [Paraferrimonas sedimenticola]
MLERIREGAQGPAAKIILILVILSFAVAGVGNYLAGGNEVVVAEVNEVQITANQLEQAYQNERARLEQQMGDMFDSLAADPNYLDSVKQGVLERLVTKTLLEQAAQDLGLRVSDELVRDTIGNMEEFKIAGAFNNERYLALIRQIGMTPKGFAEMIRMDMIRTQLLNAITNSEFVLEGESQALTDLTAQTRDFEYTIIEAEPLKAGITVSPDEINTYYQENAFQFNAPELIALEYIELSAADLAADVSVSDEEIDAYYQDNMSQYRSPEKRLAAHILVSKDQDDAEAKAQAIYAELQGGADFAELAQTRSDDTFSGENGGTLDWFEMGVMDPGFDQALFNTEKGQYSEVFESDFGYQIVKVMDVQESSQASLESVREDVADELKEQQARNRFFELQQTLADVSYEVPDTLQEAAEAIGAEIKSTELFNRMSAPAPFNSADVLRQAFSGEVLDERLNSEVVTVDQDHVLVFRVKQYQEAGTRPLEEVSEAIEQQLVHQKAVDKAQETATSVAEQVRQGIPTMEQFTSETAVARFGTQVDPSVVAQAFKMAYVQGETAVETVEVGTGVAVIKLNGVTTPTSDDQQLLQNIAQRLESQYIEGEYQGIIGLLKSQADIRYNQVASE